MGCALEKIASRNRILLRLICFGPQVLFNVFAKSSTNPAHVEPSRKYQQKAYRNHEVLERSAYVPERTRHLDLDDPTTEELSTQTGRRS
jgi:hypothetical protein